MLFYEKTGNTVPVRYSGKTEERMLDYIRIVNNFLKAEFAALEKFFHIREEPLGIRTVNDPVIIS